MHEPLLVARPDEHVAALDALAVEGGHDLSWLPLVQLVPALIPDLHRASAVLALGDLSREVDVRHRVILGPDSEVGDGRVGAEALGHRPRHQDALAMAAGVA